MPTKPPAQLKFISEKLSDLYEETVAEPLPERWVDLINRLSERELPTDDASDGDSESPS